jgi:hypothetical protein
MPETTTNPMTPTRDDLRDMLEEMPRRVQSAVLSNALMTRTRPSLYFYDYPHEVAEYIESMNLMSVEWGFNGGVRFRPNGVTRLIQEDIQRLIELY